jgi:hypothetical protein
MKTIIIFIVLLLTACATPETFRVTCTIPETSIVVFGSKYKTGYATKHLIHMSGEMVDGKVKPYPEVLFDEFMHTLGIACPGVFLDNNDKHRIK